MKYKQIKKMGGRFFITKNLPPQFFYLLKKRKKCLKKAENFWCNFSGQHFCKKNTHKKNWFLFGHLILSSSNFYTFMVLKVSFSTVLFLKQSEK